MIDHRRAALRNGSHAPPGLADARHGDHPERRAERLGGHGADRHAAGLEGEDHRVVLAQPLEPGGQREPSGTAIRERMLGGGLTRIVHFRTILRRSPSPGSSIRRDASDLVRCRARTPRPRSSPGAASGASRNSCASATESSPPGWATPAARTSNPTYRNHPGHAEAVEIVFDPERISYRDILEFFFQIHDPSTKDRQGNDIGSSYRSEIFYTSDEQRQVAEDTIADVDASGLWPGKVVTELSEAVPFWEAEPEHQDYLQKLPERLHLPLPASGLEAAAPRDGRLDGSQLLAVDRLAGLVISSRACSRSSERSTLSAAARRSPSR